jgi:hypothetical protein
MKATIMFKNRIHLLCPHPPKNKTLKRLVNEK